MATVPTGARIGGRLACHRSQPECVIEFAVCQQSGIGRDQGAAKLQHQTAVKIELENWPITVACCIHLIFAINNVPRSDHNMK